MKVVVSAEGNSPDTPASPVFGRCPIYIFIDTETMAFEAVPNPAMAQGGGAGIQAVQFVLNQGAEAVLTGSLGPNAFEVLQAAGIPGYLATGGSVRQVVEAFTAGRLQPMGAANVSAHAGMGRGRQQVASAPPPSPSPRDAQLAELRETLKGLRQQLAETMTKIEKLEKEG